MSNDVINGSDQLDIQKDIEANPGVDKRNVGWEEEGEIRGRTVFKGGSPPKIPPASGPASNGSGNPTDPDAPNDSDDGKVPRGGSKR